MEEIERRVVHGVGKPRIPEATGAVIEVGLLHHELLSGYDIRKRIAASIGLFWDAGYGQIYSVRFDHQFPANAVSVCQVAIPWTEKGFLQRHIYCAPIDKNIPNSVNLFDCVERNCD